MNDKYIYDVETFINFFCVTFYNVSTKEYSQYEISFRKNESSDLTKFMSNVTHLIGFNNIDFDAPVLNYALHVPHSNRIFEFAQILIKGSSEDKDKMKKWTYKSWDWHDHDLFRMLNFNNTHVGLKYTSVALRHKKVQDLPIHYSDEVTYENADLVLLYNKNDVDITATLYNTVESKWKLREQLGIKWGIDFMSSSDSKMGTDLLEQIYVQLSGVDLNKLRPLRTFRDSVAMKDIILDKINFKTKELQYFLENLKKKILYSSGEFKHKEKLLFGGHEYTFASGGLHSVDSPGVFEADENTLLCDYDFSSYYPNLIIQYGFKPEHLDASFIELMSKITADRIKAKKEQGSKSTEAEALKIVINALFGKLGSPFHWVYDPKSMLSVTINGQLFLLMIVEELHLSGIECISANTDGILCKFDVSKKEEFERITKNYMQYMKIEGEYTYYKKYIRRDVNTYITIKTNGEYKYKGALMPSAELGKGYKHPISPKAVFDFYVYGKPVEETIKECQDIHLFCIAQKIGGDFTPELHYDEIKENVITDEEQEVIEETENESLIEVLQKTTRFYVSNNGGSFYKRKKDGSLFGLVVGKKVTVLNDIDDTKPIGEYDINYQYYIDEAYKFIDEITPRFVPRKRFNVSQTNFQPIVINITKKPEENPYKALLLEKYTGESFWKKLKSVMKKKVALNLHGFYYVKAVNTNYSPKIEVLSFKTMKNPIVKTKKETYNKAIVKEDMVIFCNKWIEKNKQMRQDDGSYLELEQKEHWMLDYRIVTEKELKNAIEKALNQ